MAFALGNFMTEFGEGHESFLEDSFALAHFLWKSLRQYLLQYLLIFPILLSYRRREKNYWRNYMRGLLSIKGFC